MLDLNLDIVSSENKKVLINGDTLTLALMEDSGSMNSFIINADDVPSNAGDDVENSSNNASALVFDTFKKGTTDDDDTTMITDVKILEQLSSPEFVTRQLFPVTAGDKEGEAKSSSARPWWLNLSFTVESSGGDAAELKAQPRKNRRGPRSRSSQFRGVTFYRRTGRWESHIWNRGKQVYLGGFDTAHAAARAYDRAAIKFRGIEADINFDLSDYQEDMKHMKNMSKEEFVHFLRHQITKFSKGSSNYKGVTSHKYGRWESRMGQFLGKKFDDMVEMKCNEREAATNFEPSSYEGEITNNGGATFIEVIIAILLPPLGVFLRYGLEVEFWIDLVLSLLGYIPGIIYAIYVLVA